jgi:hypothetical protein
MKLFHKDNLNIEFWTTVPGLSKIEEVVPKKQSSVLPDWWRTTKYHNKSIRQCPSFPQMFSTSYVLPMWCDTEFIREGDMFHWKTPTKTFSWSYHTPNQFLDHTPNHVRNQFFAVAKAICPWRIKTPKGYSVYQMPAQWHFNEKFTVATGIVDTDFHHEINQQVFLSLEDGESFFIERGTPLAVYFPFKRDKFSLLVREQSEKDFIDDQTSSLIYTTKFLNGYRDHKKFLENKKII